MLRRLPTAESHVRYKERTRASTHYKKNASRTCDFKHGLKELHRGKKAQVHRLSRDTGDRLLCRTTSRRWSEIRRGHPGHQRKGIYICQPRATTTATANSKVVGVRKTGDGKNWTEETEVVEEEVFVCQSGIIKRRRIFSICGLTGVSRQSEVTRTTTVL